MTARELFIMVLRSWGVLKLVTVLFGATNIAMSMSFEAERQQQGVLLGPRHWLMMWGQLGLVFFWALVVIVFAPQIANLLYGRPDPAERPEPLRLDCGDLFGAGLRLLGLYTLLQAGTFAVQLLRFGPSSELLTFGSNLQMKSSVGQVALYTVAGLAMVLLPWLLKGGARRTAQSLHETLRPGDDPPLRP